VLQNKRLLSIFQSTSHPFVIVLYFYRAHEYKFSEKLAVVAIESLKLLAVMLLCRARPIFTFFLLHFLLFKI